MEISEKRLKELEQIEMKMQALEAGGVDNWEFYDESLTKFRELVEFDEKMESKFEDILEALCNGIEEPAGRGCGYGFRSKESEDAFQIFKEYIKSIRKD